MGQFDNSVTALCTGVVNVRSAAQQLQKFYMADNPHPPGGGKRSSVSHSINTRRLTRTITEVDVEVPSK